MEILVKNEAALRRHGDIFFEAYEEAKKGSICHCYIAETEREEKIICCARESRLWRLNSYYNPNRAAKLYAERYDKIQDFAGIYFFGLSDGRVIKEVLKKCNETQHILIYEPDIEIFLQAIVNFSLEEIFENEQVVLIVNGINEDSLADCLFEMVTYQNRMLMMNCILPNYDVLYPQQCKDYIDKMIYYSELEVFRKNTEIDLAAKFGDNLLMNLPYLINSSSVSLLLEYFSKMNLENVPAIIVSAGPSLDKNIKELKNAAGKAFIIGVDSALRALVREEIPFQIAVTVDPRKNPDVFADDRVYEYPYIVSGYSLPLVVEKSKNRLFFEGGYGFRPFQNIITKKTGQVLRDLKTGGSVATDALSLAFELGFKNVILIGQDLAFTDGRGHVSGFEKSEQKNREHVEQRVLVEVEALGGGTVQTDIQMNSYLQWFEQEIKFHPDVTVYNATEGGARIHGAVEVSLKDAIEKLCIQNMNFDDLLKEVPQLFSAEQQKELCVELIKSKNGIEKLRDKLQIGVDSYQKLIQFEKQNQKDTQEYQELLQKVYAVNRIEEENDYMELIKLYAKRAEYEAAEDIYVEEEMSVQEILERGRQMLEGYVEGCTVCIQKLEEILIPQLEEMSEHF